MLLQFTGRRRGQVPRHHARARSARPTLAATAGLGRPRSGAPALAAASRSCSTTRSARSRSIDFVDATRTGSPAAAPQISGLDSRGEAKDLALVLQTGALPYTFDQVERTDISATLGEDSLRQALIAALGGLIAVAIFLLIVYRFLGVVAIIGLADLRRSSSTARSSLFNVTLTLPGFAGLILTIGVAADANIVIFERIKEEVRAGKSVRAAIATGYRKGFDTIIDANVVTMITAFVLFAVGTGGVEGFALMLLIGTRSRWSRRSPRRARCSACSRGFRWFDNPAFMGASGREDPELAADRLHRQAPDLVRDLRAPSSSSDLARSPSRA